MKIRGVTTAIISSSFLLYLETLIVFCAAVESCRPPEYRFRLICMKLKSITMDFIDFISTYRIFDEITVAQLLVLLALPFSWTL